MSTYGMFIERKESGAPQSAGNVVAVKTGSPVKATIWMGYRPGAYLVAEWVVHG
jgi:hypothetical protein